MRFFLTAIWIVLAPPVWADVAQESAQLAALPEVPGAVAGWISVEDSEFAVAGVRVAGATDEIGEDDAWHIGSLTKSMTATLAARLVEDNQITWTATIGEVLGQQYPDMDPAWQDVTLAMLLRHASGMDANLGRWRSLWLGDGPRANYLEAMLADEPVGDQGAFAYSNAGYVVAGAMLEAAAGAPWEELMQTQIFAPLGIESAGFGPPQGGVPEGHSVNRRGVPSAAGQGRAADNIPAMGPAGRVHLSASDMLLYLRAHLIRDEDFLSAESWRRLQTPEGEGLYAFGWVSDGNRMQHSGSNTLWYATAYIDREAGRAGFVAVNSGDREAVEDPIAEAVQRLVGTVD
ncbi:serine hydrolase domain-containing protein [Gymnodinialimonas sp. 2305UL16-5]|uniref:serine hydrolase domain-containing protein n=1 Tax=Gymnodinialimonas mytili TaxID=3126503 RepID=UPI0030AD40F2